MDQAFFSQRDYIVDNKLFPHLSIVEKPQLEENVKQNISTYASFHPPSSWTGMLVGNVEALSQAAPGNCSLCSFLVKMTAHEWVPLAGV